jgi:Fe-S-cluster containining protein
MNPRVLNVHNQDSLQRICRAFDMTCAALGKYPNVVEALQITFATKNAAFDVYANQMPKSEYECKKGCSACCHQMVAARPFEVLAIARQILDNYGTEKISQVHARIADFKLYPIIAELRYGRKFACPLLFEGRCGVYEVRPQTCRSVYVQKRKMCDDALAAGGGQVNYLSEPMSISNEMDAGIACAMRSRLGVNVDRVELIGALDIALQDFEKVSLDWFKRHNPFSKVNIDNEALELDELNRLISNTPRRPTN